MFIVKARKYIYQLKRLYRNYSYIHLPWILHEEATFEKGFGGEVRQFKFVQQGRLHSVVTLLMKPMVAVYSHSHHLKCFLEEVELGISSS